MENTQAYIPATFSAGGGLDASPYPLPRRTEAVARHCQLSRQAAGPPQAVSIAPQIYQSHSLLFHLTMISRQPFHDNSDEPDVWIHT